MTKIPSTSASQSLVSMANPQWIDVSVIKATNDPRSESYKLNVVHRHAKEWIIVGLFYPPHAVVRDLFD
jgi:hypothetical protein